MMKPIAGKQYGFLTVLQRVANSPSSAYAMWKVRCVCGQEVVRNTQQLHKYKGSKMISCGCKKREMYVDARKTHGWSGHPLYQIYKGMLSRCYSQKDKAYHRYGGRGIQVCPAWRASFANFLSDMGSGYQPGLELDRENNDGNYEAKNCRWVDRLTQCNNKARHVMVDTPKGRMTVSQAARTFNISRYTLYQRAHAGRTGADLISKTPLARRSTTLPTAVPDIVSR